MGIPRNTVGGSSGEEAEVEKKYVRGLIREEGDHLESVVFGKSRAHRILRGREQSTSKCCWSPSKTQSEKCFEDLSKISVSETVGVETRLE